ncbi:uncharacterized protein [Primulina huaijiensis]|uniref:uncharacterized protein n=1 Tax=Primulina huaijiensis TaxID=1492673 RepID=UPI003CC7283F
MVIRLDITAIFDSIGFDGIFVTRRIFISGVATYALLDSGATYSFIFETFVKQVKIIPEDLDLGLRVSILSGDQMVTTSIVRNLELRLLKNAVLADLIVLPMPNFDIILEMDWLSLNGVSIYFRQRSVFIRLSSGKSLSLRQQGTSKFCTLSPASVRGSL